MSDTTVIPEEFANISTCDVCGCLFDLTDGRAYQEGDFSNPGKLFCPACASQDEIEQLSTALENSCQEIYRELLEETEKERDELDNYVSRLIWNLTDGRLSRPYDLSIVLDEVETIYREYYENHYEKVHQENEKLTKMVDYLASLLTENCLGVNDMECAIKSCPHSSNFGCNAVTKECWVEKAEQFCSKQLD